MNSHSNNRLLATAAVVMLSSLSMTAAGQTVAQSSAGATGMESRQGLQGNDDIVTRDRALMTQEQRETLREGGSRDASGLEGNDGIVTREPGTMTEAQREAVREMEPRNDRNGISGQRSYGLEQTEGRDGEAVSRDGAQGMGDADPALGTGGIGEPEDNPMVGPGQLESATEPGAGATDRQIQNMHDGAYDTPGTNEGAYDDQPTYSD